MKLQAHNPIRPVTLVLVALACLFLGVVSWITYEEMEETTITVQQGRAMVVSTSVGNKIYGPGEHQFALADANSWHEVELGEMQTEFTVRAKGGMLQGLALAARNSRLTRDGTLAEIGEGYLDGREPVYAKVRITYNLSMDDLSRIVSTSPTADFERSIFVRPLEKFFKDAVKDAEDGMVMSGLKGFFGVDKVDINSEKVRTKIARKALQDVGKHVRSQSGIEITQIDIPSIQRLLDPPAGDVVLTASARHPVPMVAAVSPSFIGRVFHNVWMMILGGVMLVLVILGAIYCPEVFQILDIFSALG